MDGVLVIDKPAGPTSHDVVAVVRRAIGIDRIGHTGTLDPLATGVLALVVGRATRLASYLSAADKEYVATVRFGASSATYDAEAAADATDRVAPPADQMVLTAVLPEFLGTSLQQPPPYSAKKIAGTPAYKLARQRKPVEIKPVQVTVRELELCGYSDGVAELRIVCSSGFYVRSLAHDLGQRVGCGAFLETLKRTRAGDFRLEDAAPLSAVIAEGFAARRRVIPIDRLLTDMPSVVLTDEGVRRTGHGNVLRPGDFSIRGGAASADAPGAAPRVRLLDSTDALVGLAEPRPDGGLHPVIVLGQGSGVRC
jgi:tRNA pseudouridine55 synthase